MSLKYRLTNGWTIKRGVYIAMGVTIFIQAFFSGHYIGFLLGAYFTAMGLFAFGCAGGNCFNNNCATDQEITKASDSNTFNEIKTK